MIIDLYKKSNINKPQLNSYTLYIHYVSSNHNSVIPAYSGIDATTTVYANPATTTTTTMTAATNFSYVVTNKNTFDLDSKPTPVPTTSMYWYGLQS